MRRLGLNQSLKSRRYSSALWPEMDGSKIERSFKVIWWCFRNQASNETMSKPTPSAIVLHAISADSQRGNGVDS